MSALAKEEGSDTDMAEMIASEIETLSNQLKKLEENLKVSLLNFSYEIIITSLILAFSV